MSDAEDVPTAEEDTPSPLGSAGWMWAAAALYLTLAWLPIPGIDRALLDFGSIAPPPGNLLGSAIESLFAVHLVLWVTGLSERRGARLAGLAVYLVLSAASALAVVFWLESLNATVPFGDVVSEPGWRFRILGVCAAAVGAALVWFVAERIDGSRRARGALFFIAISVLVTGLTGAFDAGDQTATRGSLLPAATAFAPLLAMAALTVFVAVARRPWPVPAFGSLDLRSPWDVGALAAAAGMPTIEGLYLAALGPPPAWLAWHEAAACSLAVVLVIALWMRRREQAGEASARTWVPAVVCVAATLAGLGLALTGLLTSDALALRGPGPLTGANRLEMVLVPEDGGFAEGDARRMVARLEALGAEVEATESGSGAITLRFEAVSTAADVMYALRPRRLGLHLASPLSDVSAVALPQGIGLDSRQQHLAGDCDALELWSREGQRSCSWALQRIESELDEGPSCHAYCLEPAAINSDDVEEASVQFDEYANRPVVALTLTEGAAERMRALSSANNGRVLAIVIDDEILSAPVISGEFGAHVQITLGGYRDFDELLQEAHQLATALGSDSPLRTRAVLQEERRY